MVYNRSWLSGYGNRLLVISSRTIWAAEMAGFDGLVSNHHLAKTKDP